MTALTALLFTAALALRSNPESIRPDALRPPAQTKQAGDGPRSLRTVQADQLDDEWLEDQIIIDPRPAGVYAEAHLPGSINLTWEELQTRREWLQRTLIVVTPGYVDNDFGNGLAMVKRAGFAEPLVLIGGLFDWERAGRRLTGMRHTERPYRWVDAEVYLELAREQTGLTLAEPQKIWQWPSCMTVWTASSGGELDRSQFWLERWEKAGRPGQVLFLVTADGEGYRRLWEAGYDRWPIPVMAVRGGAMALAKANQAGHAQANDWAIPPPSE